MHLTLVLNAHREGHIVVESILSALAAQSAALKQGAEVELILVLDKGDQLTTRLASQFSNQITVYFVDFGDLGAARNFGVSKSLAEFVAFQDCDDLISDNWLIESLSLYKSLTGDAVLHPEINYFFGPWYKSASRIIFKHHSSTDSSFSFATLADQNPWTALCFSRRKVFLEHPYKKIDVPLGIGFEDWNFNLETLAANLPHLVVPNTVHFIRQKGSKSLKRRSAKAHARIRDMRNLRTLAQAYKALGTEQPI